MKQAAALLFLSIAAGCQAVSPRAAVAPQRTPEPFALYHRHDYTEAALALQADTSPDALLVRADCERHLAHSAQEFELLKRAVRATPAAVGGWLALADYEIRAGQFDHAEMALRRAIAVNPTCPTAWTTLGMIYLRKHQTEDALACLNRALVPVPQGPVATAKE